MRTKRLCPGVKKQGEKKVGESLYIHTYIHAYTYIYVYIYTDIDIYTDIHRHTDINIPYTHTHTHTHTHTQRNNKLNEGQLRSVIHLDQDF